MSSSHTACISNLTGPQHRQTSGEAFRAQLDLRDQERAATLTFRALSHYLGNRVTSIIGNLELVKKDVNESERVNAGLISALEALKPLGLIPQQLSAMSDSKALHDWSGMPPIEGKSEGQVVRGILTAVHSEISVAITNAINELPTERGDFLKNDNFQTVQKQIKELEAVQNFLNEARLKEIRTVLTIPYEGEKRMVFLGTETDLASEVIAAYRFVLEKKLDAISGSAKSMWASTDQSSHSPLHKSLMAIQEETAAVTEKLAKYHLSLQNGDSSAFELGGDSGKVLSSVVLKLNGEILPHVRKIAELLVPLVENNRLGEITDQETVLSPSASLSNVERLDLELHAALPNVGLYNLELQTAYRKLIQVKTFLDAAKNLKQFDRVLMPDHTDRWMASISYDA
ncbi:MAG: hypothetical protein V1909_06475 [Candidatus Micrarchaeota archaeon]